MTSLHALINWLDSARWHFWLVALSATVFWLYTIWREPFNRIPADGKTPSPAWKLWALATTVLLFAWRWPYLVGPAVLNPDEAQMMAAAITLKARPIFWKFIDGTTHGPLADYALVAPTWLGLPLNYVTVRAVAGILILGGWICAARGLMHVYPARAVRIGLLAPMLLWASISFYDFTGYTSEQFALFLLLTAIWPVLSALARTDLQQWQRVWRLTLAGALVGGLPYSKLQSAPLGVMFGLIVIGGIFISRFTLKQRVQQITGMVIGALLPTVFTAFYIWHHAIFEDFWSAFIKKNLIYSETGHYSTATAFKQFWGFLGWPPGLHTLIWTTVALGAGLAALYSFSKDKNDPNKRSDTSTRLSPYAKKVMLALVLLMVAAVFVALAPRRAFHHYLQFVAIVVGLSSVFFCGEISLLLKRHSQRFQQAVLLFLLIGLAVPLVIARHARQDPDMFGEWTRRGGENRHPVSVEIARIKQPGDDMSVWGWMPRFNAETNTPQGTRESHAEPQINDGPMREFYRERYVQDFTLIKPRIFVDAVGGTNFAYDASRRENAGHETLPALREIIARDYTFHTEIEGCRIYLRK